MSKKFNKVKGNEGEDYATKYLEENDYKIITKNFDCSFGELDIVATKDKEIIFVEVKTRFQEIFGMPCESVTPTKLKHLYNTAKYFLYKNNTQEVRVRFDVIEVFIDDDVYAVNHIKDIIYDDPNKIFRKS